MNKIIYLSTCNTCQRILKELEEYLPDDVILQDSKERHITDVELDKLAEALGGYEKSFNKRAMKYRKQGLNTQELTEEDFKKHILSEYTFLKRPAFFFGDFVTAGNSKKVIQSAKDHLIK